MKPHYLLYILLVALCACSSEPRELPPENGAGIVGADSPSATANNVSEVRDSDTAGWTASAVSRPGDSVATLQAVRAARHDGFERIVFEFGAGPLPGYRVEYVDRPIRQCGSGETVALPGDAWLSVRLEPARAHTEAGQPTVRERQQVLNYEIIKQLNIICDFEAIVEWVVAVGSPNRYRVLELKAPTRLVIDIRK